jgi:hypothetical protein
LISTLFGAGLVLFCLGLMLFRALVRVPPDDIVSSRGDARPPRARHARPAALARRAESMPR